MKLEKAIEHLNAIKESGLYLGEPDDSKAVQLGIEALKRVQDEEAMFEEELRNRLPGETEG